MGTALSSAVVQLVGVGGSGGIAGEGKEASDFVYTSFPGIPGSGYRYDAKAPVGPFEHLYLSRARWYEEEQQALWHGLVENPSLGVVLPLPHLLPELKMLRYLKASLQSATPVGQAYLLSGQQGIGKTFLFKTFAALLHASQAAVSAKHDKLTVPCYVDLSTHTASVSDHFCTRLLDMIVDHLRTAKQRLELVETLSELSGAAPDRVNDLAQKLALGPLGILDLRLLKVGVASALLTMSGVSVIVFVDEVECLFKDTHFSAQCAGEWLHGMEAVPRMDSTAIGMVLCASSSRTHLLFRCGSQRDAFPRGCTHTHLRRDWGGRLSHIRLQNCCWMKETLMAYLLSHIGSASCPSFCMYTRDVDWRPHPANLNLTRDLDRLCQFCPEGATDVSPHGRLRAFLEHVLRVCGHSPQHVRELAQKLAKSDLSSLTSWPMLEMSEEQRIAEASSVERQQALCAVVSNLDSAASARLRTASHVTFDSADFTVSRQVLVASLLPPDDVLHAVALQTGRDVFAVKSSAHYDAVGWISDAVDAGWLADYGRTVGLGSLLAYRNCVSREARPRAADVMGHPGSAIEAELPVTPESASSDMEHHVQLAGMRGADGDGLAKHGGLLAAAGEARGTLSRPPTKARTRQARKAGRAAASLGRAKRRRSSVAHKPQAKRKARM